MSAVEDRIGRAQNALDDTAEIACLAALNPVEYDRQRVEAAGRLECRVETLDREVRKARGDTETDGQGQAIEFPEVQPDPNPVDGSILLAEMIEVIGRYVILPDHAAEACALWAVMTWLADEFDLLPLLRVLSPTKRCGKTRLIEVMAELVHRPMTASGVSPSAMFRIIQKLRPTLLLDEVDTYMKESEEHRQILNAGHARAAAYVIRGVGDEYDPRKFSVFGPKLLAGIGNLRDTIEDRAIRIELRRRAAGEVIGSLRKDGTEQFATIRQKIRRWVNDNRAAIRSRVADIEVPHSLSDRAADNWSPLLAIAEAAGPDWSSKAQTAARVLSVTDDADERNVELLTDIREIFSGSEAEVWKSRELLDALLNREDRPWNECNRGRPLTTNSLATRLRSFHIRPHDVRPPGSKNVKGYRAQDFAEAFTRYLPVIEPRHRDNVGPARPATDSSVVTSSPAVTDQNRLNGNTGAGCHGVTDESPRDEAKGDRLVSTEV